MVAVGKTKLMKEQMIINAGTERKICGAPKNPSYLSSQGVEAVGEELTGTESVKWYIRLSLICTVLGVGGSMWEAVCKAALRLGRQLGRQLNKILRCLCGSNRLNSRAGGGASLTIHGVASTPC